MKGLLKIESALNPPQLSHFGCSATSAQKLSYPGETLLLSEKDLFAHFSEVLHYPLPFSKSALQKDRLDGRLGVPFRRVGGAIFYDTNHVRAWLDGIPIVVPARAPLHSKPPVVRRGKPLKSETVEAARLGISVPELRAQNAGVKS